MHESSKVWEWLVFLCACAKIAFPNELRYSANMGATEAKEAMSLNPKTSVSFKLNGTSVEVQGVSPSLTLNAWLRTQPGMTGTKRMCGEGGCGCCVVAVSLISPVTQKETRISINSVKIIILYTHIIYVLCKYGYF